MPPVNALLQNGEVVGGQGGEQQDAPLEGEWGPGSHDPCGVPGILMLQKKSSTENVWKSKVHIKKPRVQMPEQCPSLPPKTSDGKSNSEKCPWKD